MIECRSDKSNREELGMTYMSRLLTVKIQKKMARIPVQNTSTPNTRAEHLNTKYPCRTPQHQIPYGSIRIHGILDGSIPRCCDNMNTSCQGRVSV